MRDTKPVFILGSGRSGTRTFFRMLSGTQGLEIHHEYAVPALQSLVCKYYMGLIDEREIERFLEVNHGAAMLYSNSEIWCDSSNKLVWVIDILNKIYPECKFVGIVRDGRKVVPSYYYKLREEIYDQDCVLKLANWIKGEQIAPPPPPEKKYWWNIPQPGQRWADEFPSFDRFQMVCYHWTNSNLTILDSFQRLPSSKYLLLKLEDLKTNEESLKYCIDFMGLKYDPIFYQYLKTPRNVFYPLQYRMNSDQTRKFNIICSDAMSRLGYTAMEEYDVKY